MNERLKKLVIIIGPPGSGKGTQAELLAKQDYYHLETSKLLEKIVRSKSQSSFAKKLRKQFFAGKLLEPKVVCEIILKEVKRLLRRGIKKIVFSGSPRTLYEAQGEMPQFEKIFSKDNIKIFLLEVKSQESIKRNLGRKICSICRYPVPRFKKYKKCPKCGGNLIKRELDNLKVIKKRLKEYKNRTEPVINFFIKNNYRIIKIKGNQSIKKVQQDISKYL